jgi:hypothetical protein
MRLRYNLRDMLYYLKSKDYAKYNGQDKYNEHDQFLKENIYEAIKEHVEYFAHHPKLYENQNVFFEVPISCLRILKLTLDELLELQNRFIKSATGLYGRRYDNNAWILFSDNYGRLFQTYIHKDGSGYGLNLYDSSGRILLVKINTKNNELTREEIQQLESAWDLLMKYFDDQKRSQERFEEIKKFREYIKVELVRTGYTSKYYKVTVSKEIPIELSNDEIAKYCDDWNYCFGGSCNLVKEDSESKVYNVVVYTD